MLPAKAAICAMQADLIAGATVAVMAVPQAVSFAAMAGLPAAFGLYTAFVPVLAYCFTGSSRHLVSALDLSQHQYTRRSLFIFEPCWASPPEAARVCRQDFAFAVLKQCFATC